MAQRFSMAAMLLISGSLLALLGFILWSALGIPSDFPPYLLTALLALTYGLCCFIVGKRKAPRHD